MKKKFKIKVLMAISIIGLFSIRCNSDDPSAVATNECQLESIKTIISEGILEYNFNYSTAGKLSSGTFSTTLSGSTNHYTIITNDKGLVTEVINSGNSEPYYSYIYNSNNQLVEATLYIKDQPYLKYSYTYTLSGQLAKVQDAIFSAGEFKPWDNTVYQYTNTTSGNPTRAETVHFDGSKAYTYTYEYDNMKNPAKGLSVATGSFATENNIAKAGMFIHHTNKNLATEMVYEYNTQGYPIKVVTSGETQGGQMTSTTTVYEYQCN